MTKVLFNPPRYFLIFFYPCHDTIVISWSFMNLSSICFGVNDMNTTITPCVNKQYCSEMFMEETGEQCTVVFALIVITPTPPRFRNDLCKGDSTLFSRFLYGNILSRAVSSRVVLILMTLCSSSTLALLCVLRLPIRIIPHPNAMIESCDKQALLLFPILKGSSHKIIIRKNG
jgi:hypothetical protein